MNIGKEKIDYFKYSHQSIPNFPEYLNHLGIGVPLVYNFICISKHEIMENLEARFRKFDLQNHENELSRLFICSIIENLS